MLAKFSNLVSKFNFNGYAILAVVGLGFWALWFSGILGGSGVFQAYRLSMVRRDLGLKVVALENEKARLQATILSADRDAFVQEQAIRESLGWVRPHELVFEFK